MWFCLLLASICLEGLGRKFVPGVPQFAWYISKDVLLLVGMASFGLGRAELAVGRKLFSPFFVVMAGAGLWTIFEMVNPAQGSVPLALLGLRSYWLWWIAPFIVARALRRDSDFGTALSILALLALVVAVMAAIQFESPPDAWVNRYAWGEMGIAGVEETGRVRVSSTFAYLTGFTDFATLVVPLLLVGWLSERRRSRKTLYLLALGALGVTLPMSGARAPLVLIGCALVVIFWETGALSTRRGWALLVLAVALAEAPKLLAPESVKGTASRFAGDDTRGRFLEGLQVLPPVALAFYQYPPLGIGTGMQQNARFALGVRTTWDTELEIGRYLIELGPIGYLLVWTCRLGLCVALARAARALRTARRREWAGLSVALAGLAVIGNFVFNHVFQALFFVMVGLILRQCANIRSDLRRPLVESAHNAGGQG